MRTNLPAYWRGFGGKILIVAAAWLSLAVSEAATPVRAPAGKVTGGFQAPVFDEKGDLKTQFEGEGFKPLADGRYLITQFTLKTYKGRNEVDLIAQASECFFRQTENVAHSPGPLKVRQSSGRFELDGVGFEWRQSTGQLVVSNKVQTRIRQTLTNRTDSVEGDFEVAADRLEYTSREQNTVAIFKGRVHARQPGKLDLKCEMLTVRLGSRNSGFEEILANDSVEVLVTEAGSTYRATGNKARFNPAAGEGSVDRVVIEGAAGWSARGFDGAGDLLTLVIPAGRGRADAAGGRLLNFEVNGNARLHVPEGMIGNSSGSTNRMKAVDVSSGSYTYKDSQVLFVGDVKAVSEGEWSVRSSRLEVLSAAATNRVERILATGSVNIELSGQGAQGEIGGERAELDVVGGRLDVSGKPQWKLREMSGSGDSVRIFTRAREPDVEVLGRSVLLLPGGAFSGRSLVPVLDAKASDLPAAAGGNETQKSGPVRVESSGMRLTGRDARFQGPVAVQSASGSLHSKVLNAKLGPGGKGLESLQAEGEVHLRQGMDSVKAGKLDASISSSTGRLELLVAEENVDFELVQGERMTRGKGQKVVFDAAKNEALLEGNPEISMESGILLECEERIQWNLLTRKIRARNYKISGTKESLKSVKLPGKN